MGRQERKRALSYQRLVKTTPKPRATKNNNGELLPLLSGLVLFWLLAFPPPAEVWGISVEDITDDADGVIVGVDETDAGIGCDVGATGDADGEVATGGA